MKKVLVYQGEEYELKPVPEDSDAGSPIKEYLQTIGRAGGKATAAKLTPEERSERARKMNEGKKRKKAKPC